MKDPKWEWQYKAKCRTIDHSEVCKEFGLRENQATELWYPPRDAEVYGPMADYSKGVCKGTKGSPECPVRFECLKQAIDNDEEHGIWGGFSHRERNALLRKLQRKHLTIEDYYNAKGMP